MPAVWVMRTNFASTGSKAMVVDVPLPLPSFTEVQPIPSIETSTL